MAVQGMNKMKKRIRVYVAGPYSGNNVLSILQNIGRGEKVCAELFKMGFAPFCPWHDKSYVIDNTDTDFSVEDFYEYSIEWLKVSEVMLVLPGKSKGTEAEIEIAKELEIPVFYSIEKLIEYSAFFGGELKDGEDKFNWKSYGVHGVVDLKKDVLLKARLGELR